MTNKGHGQVTGKLFAKGNHKLDKSVGVFSLPPVKTCVNCSTCASTCYAMQAYKQYEHSRNAWDYNYELSKSDDFVAEVNRQLKKYKFDTIRLHSSGDFYNDDYIDKWQQIMLDNPNITFYSYTKNIKALRLNKLKNCNIIDSMKHDLRNYGSMDYCKAINKKYKAHICNLQEGQKCGRDCRVCMDKRLSKNGVVIPIHGSQKSKDTYEQKVIAYLLDK